MKEKYNIVGVSVVAPTLNSKIEEKIVRSKCIMERVWAKQLANSLFKTNFNI